MQKSKTAPDSASKKPKQNKRNRSGLAMPPAHRQYPLMIDAEEVVNGIAVKALACVKLCQEQRPLIAKRKQQKQYILLDLEFAKDFTNLLAQLETAFFQVAPCLKQTPVAMSQDIAEADSNSIPIFVDEDQLLIHTPYLPPRNVTQLHLYTEILAARLAITELPHWNRWHADICQVFPSDRIRFARDADNSDYKQLIDTLALYLRTTDAAGHFSMTADVIADDSLDPGTYIRVTPKPASNPAAEAWKIAKKV